MRLEELQRLIYRLVVAPNGVGEGLTLEESLPDGGLEAVIIGDDRLSAEQRLDIYANAYFYRLLDVFKEDFPATLAVLGETDFHNLITGYLVEYPPAEPSVAHAGQHLADFIRQHPLQKRATFLADLATLERALIESFCASDMDPLDATAMHTIGPEEWPSLQMRLHPASQLLELDHTIEPLMRSVERGESWSYPPRKAETILVWRRDTQVFYRTVETLERDALLLTQTRASFASICALIAESCDKADPTVVINQLLSRWIADEIFVRSAA
ncbi:MAG TPA: DNA-binding domain-containing protein [Candidatus Binataceae bacterium]|nr:DNA-binding domain-containing protein [Candidatus Binataceae bacterium]